VNGLIVPLQCNPDSATIMNTSRAVNQLPSLLRKWMGLCGDNDYSVTLVGAGKTVGQSALIRRLALEQGVQLREIAEKMTGSKEARMDTFTVQYQGLKIQLQSGISVCGRLLVENISLIVCLFFVFFFTFHVIKFYFCYLFVCLFIYCFLHFHFLVYECWDHFRMLHGRGY
jgi:hypothetical protein